MLGESSCIDKWGKSIGITINTYVHNTFNKIKWTFFNDDCDRLLLSVTIDNPLPNKYYLHLVRSPDVLYYYF